MRISINMLFEFICMVNARFALLQFANYRCCLLYTSDAADDYSV